MASRSIFNFRVIEKTNIRESNFVFLLVVAGHEYLFDVYNPIKYILFSQPGFCFYDEVTSDVDNK